MKIAMQYQKRFWNDKNSIGQEVTDLYSVDKKIVIPRNKIAASIDGDREKKYLYKDIASKHAKKGYEIMFDSGYGGEHWLATFAVYCLTYDN